MLYRTAANYFLLESHRPSPSPLKLTILQIAWVLPYLLLANYLERSLLPLRLVCYTQNDLLSSLPLRDDITEFDRDTPGKCRLSKKTPDLDRTSRSAATAQPLLGASDLPKFDCKLLQTMTAEEEEELLRTVLEAFVITLGDVRLMQIVPFQTHQRTGPKSLDYRNFIRETWKPQVDPIAKVIFVCAKGGDVKAEADKNKDILQFDFADSYHNLSLKMMAIYGFVLSEMPFVRDIIVTNDDTIVNATALAQLVPSKKNGSWMLGKVSRGYPRLFMPWLPWHVPGQMYPNLCYPRFTQGSSFIVSRTGAEQLLQNICKTPFVHLDDILMGLIASCSRLPLLHHNGFDKHILEDFVVYHYQYSRHSPSYLRQLWSTL